MYRSFSKFIYHGSKLHYSVFGEGPKVLLMFHGFGHTLKSMRPFEEVLASEYKIYSFDLFFHGFSEWNHNDTALESDFWRPMILAFLEENGIDKFSVLGFSLGAKVAMATTELFPAKIEQLYLVAPDGIHQNIIYRFATSFLFKGAFRSIILHPELFHRVINILSFLRLMDKSVLRFAAMQMNSRDKRRRIYYTWTVYKGLKPHMGQLTKLLNTKKIKTEVYVGKFDRIIRLDHIKPFVNQLKCGQLFTLEAGHNNLIEKAADYMERELSKR